MEAVLLWIRRDIRTAGEQYYLNHRLAKKSKDARADPERTLRNYILHLPEENRNEAYLWFKCCGNYPGVTVNPTHTLGKEWISQGYRTVMLEHGTGGKGGKPTSAHPPLEPQFWGPHGVPGVDTPDPWSGFVPGHRITPQTPPGSGTTTPLPQSPEGKGQVPGKGKDSGRSDVRYDDQGNEMWD